MKDKILKVAEKVITRRGTKVTMDELAAALNMSKRTLYKQFASKEELIETIFFGAHGSVGRIPPQINGGCGDPGGKVFA